MSSPSLARGHVSSSERSRRRGGPVKQFRTKRRSCKTDLDRDSHRRARQLKARQAAPSCCSCPSVPANTPQPPQALLSGRRELCGLVLVRRHFTVHVASGLSQAGPQMCSARRPSIMWAEYLSGIALTHQLVRLTLHSAGWHLSSHLTTCAAAPPPEAERSGPSISAASR